jgi:hypothetical protein
MEEVYMYILQSPKVFSTWGVYGTRDLAEAQKKRLMQIYPNTKEDEIQIIAAPVNKTY